MDYSHPVKFLKRFRRAIAPAVVRYFLVGEYGDLNGRPHYHAILFGYPPCVRGKTLQRDSSCCPPCDFVRMHWTHPNFDYSYGRVQLEVLQDLSGLEYVAGYVTKGLNKGNPELGRRAPERALMSKRPGIGGLYASLVAEQQGSVFGLDQVVKDGDVAYCLDHGRRSMPLDRYMRSRIRKLVNLDEKLIQDRRSVVDNFKVSWLSAALKDDPQFVREYYKQQDQERDATHQRAHQVERKFSSEKILKRRSL